MFVLNLLWYEFNINHVSMSKTNQNSFEYCQQNLPKIVHKMVHIFKLTQLNLSLCLTLALIWSIFISQIWKTTLRSIYLIKSKLVTSRTTTTFHEFFCQKFLGLSWLVTICTYVIYWSQTKITFSALTAILSYLCPPGHLMYRYRNFVINDQVFVKRWWAK